jgi:cytochrome P450
MYPDVQAKLQEEIDSVVGDSRLPSFEDRLNLPYTEAVAKEMFRWNTVSTAGLPHSLQVDDIYEGYHLPAHSVVIADLEGMLHDPQTYQDPYTFNPSRFLPAVSGRPAELDPHAIGFGFGRRICSGMKVADANLFMAVATVGAALDIGKGVVDGKLVEPVYEKMPGLVSHPKPFKLSISPRSERAGQLLSA